MSTIWNFDPNYGLPNVPQVSLPKKFQIVATWQVKAKPNELNDFQFTLLENLQRADLLAKPVPI